MKKSKIRNFIIAILFVSAFILGIVNTYSFYLNAEVSATEPPELYSTHPISRVINQSQTNLEMEETAPVASVDIHNHSRDDYSFVSPFLRTDIAISVWDAFVIAREYAEITERSYNTAQLIEIEGRKVWHVTLLYPYPNLEMQFEFNIDANTGDVQRIQDTKLPTQATSDGLLALSDFEELGFDTEWFPNMANGMAVLRKNGLEIIVINEGYGIDVNYRNSSMTFNATVAPHIVNDVMMIPYNSIIEILEAFNMQ